MSECPKFGIFQNLTKNENFENSRICQKWKKSKLVKIALNGEFWIYIPYPRKRVPTKCLTKMETSWGWAGPSSVPALLAMPNEPAQAVFSQNIFGGCDKKNLKIILLLIFSPFQAILNSFVFFIFDQHFFAPQFFGRGGSGEVNFVKILFSWANWG